MRRPTRKGRSRMGGYVADRFAYLLRLQSDPNTDANTDAGDESDGNGAGAKGDGAKGAGAKGDGAKGAGAKAKAKEGDEEFLDEQERRLAENTHTWLVEHDDDQKVSEKTVCAKLEETFAWRKMRMNAMSSFTAQKVFRYLFLNDRGVSKNAGKILFGIFS